jgi:carboxylesterase
MKNLSLFLLALLWAFSGCGIVQVKIDDSMLDGSVIKDTSFTDKSFRVSSHPDQATFDRSRPVIICVHGYGACTYEWQDFRDFAMADGRVYTSLVLLGGHGGGIENLEACSWADWQAPIIAEYDSLVKLGFTRLSIVGASTGGTLLLEYASRKAFDSRSVLPKEMFFIDPIIVPSDKLLHIITVVGPMLGNSPLDLHTDEQKRHWYTNRPASTLAQLNNLIELMRGRLEKGLSLPAGTNAKMYKATTDDSADPVGALLIYKGCTKSNGEKIDVEMVDSDLHVFTRLAARDAASQSDSLLQKRVFKEMVDRVAAHQ